MWPACLEFKNDKTLQNVLYITRRGTVGQNVVTTELGPCLVSFLGASLSAQVDLPELGEERHQQEDDIEDDEEDAVGAGEVETLQWDEHKGQHQTESQRSRQHPA